MTSLVEQMADYAAHHRQHRTKLTHFVGVPAIVLAVLVLLALVRFRIGGLTISLAILFVAAMIAWYVRHDFAIGAALVVLIAPLLLLAEWAARQPLPVALGIFAVLFVGGWIVQLVGHRIEGNRPAFLDNLAHLVIAPAFLTAEFLFALGLKRDLHEEIERRVAMQDAHPGPGRAAAR